MSQFESLDTFTICFCSDLTHDGPVLALAIYISNAVMKWEFSVWVILKPRVSDTYDVICGI